MSVLFLYACVHKHAHYLPAYVPNFYLHICFPPLTDLSITQVVNGVCVGELLDNTTHAILD